MYHLLAALDHNQKNLHAITTGRYDDDDFFISEWMLRGQNQCQNWNTFLWCKKKLVYTVILITILSLHRIMSLYKLKILNTWFGTL